MNKSQLVSELKNRLLSLLKDPVFAKARQDRAGQSQGLIPDALVAHNMAVSEEILRLDESSVNGVVKDKKIDEFRKHIVAYMEKNGTGNKGYDNYIAINSEYLALVAHKPLHPVEVRHIENNPPKDTDHRKYCAWKARHIKDIYSLCRFCNCMPWPEATAGDND
jgi:uncharacterized protein (UPF0305 family)